MGHVMEQLKKYAIVRGIVYIILGFLVLMNPNSVFQVGVYIISAYVAIMGILNLIDGIKLKTTTGDFGMTFLGGILQLVVAAFILAFSKSIISILPIFLGLVILIAGVSKMMQATSLRQYVNVSWLPMFIYSILLIIAGLVLIFNPFTSVLVLFQLFGIVLICMGIGEIFAFFQLSKIS